MPKSRKKPLKIKNLIGKYANLTFLKVVLCETRYLWLISWFLLVFEFFLNIFIIERVSYTEIDWRAYMQEVEGFLNGTLDYAHLKGDTGPLVYPAGFLYVYSALYYATNHGHNIKLAQYIFAGLYLVQLWLTYRIFRKTAKIPPYGLVLVAMTSYRIHSIYVLRMFNDPVAVFFFYVALNLFIDDRWRMGSVFYSIAVSIKMNILLYAPCVLIAYLLRFPPLEVTIQLVICALIQFVLGAPFLLTHPWTYLKGSFDLGRIFQYQWTVNYRFVPKEMFESRFFHIGLLMVHVGLLMCFVPLIMRYLRSYFRLKQMKNHGELTVINQLFVLPFYVVNFIGLICARSLHYQFYSWYYHSLLYMVVAAEFPHKSYAFLLLGLIEYCWNTYPSTDFSSGMLHCCHIILLVALYRKMRI